MNKELIINNIEKRRKIFNISQIQLAQKIGMSKNGYNVAVQNKDIKLSTLLKIAEVLEVPVSYFFDEGGDNINNSNNVINNVSNGNGKQTLIIGQKDNEIEGLQKEVQVLKEQISELKTIIGQKDQMIEQLMTIHRG